MWRNFIFFQFRFFNGRIKIMRQILNRVGRICSLPSLKGKLTGNMFSIPLEVSADAAAANNPVNCLQAETGIRLRMPRAARFHRFAAG